MKNFKVMVALGALIAIGNACALEKVEQDQLTRLVTLIKTNPKRKLTETQLNSLRGFKAMEADDAFVQGQMKELRAIKSFDFKQLEVAPAVEERPVVTTQAVTPKPTPVRKVTPVKKAAPVRKVVKQKPLTAVQEKKLEAQEKKVATEPSEVTGSYPADVPMFTAHIYYDDATGNFSEIGVAELVDNVRAKYPTVESKVKLISQAYNEGVEYLKIIRNETTVPSHITDELRNMVTKNVMAEAPVEGEMGRKVVVGFALKDATSVDDFIKRTKMDLRVFYKNGQLQQAWFDDFVNMAKKENPSITPELLNHGVRENAIALMRIVRNIPEKKTLSTTDLNAISNTIKKSLSKTFPPMTKEEPTMTMEEIQKRLTTMETQLYWDELQDKLAAMETELYYDETTGLLRESGIQNIIETIKKTDPAISYENLIATAYNKAAELLKKIKKQTLLDKKTQDTLIQMINDATKQYQVTAVKLKPQELGQAKLVQRKTPPLEPIERRAAIGSMPEVRIFTPTLKELKTIPMKEYYETPEKSFSATLPQPLSKDLVQFIEDSKKRGLTAKTLDEDWMLNAVGHILHGKLRKDNEDATLQKLFEVADAVVGEKLRNDQTISDDEYTRIASAIEQKIENFMSKLYVGSEYYPRK